MKSSSTLPTLYVAILDRYNQVTALTQGSLFLTVLTRGKEEFSALNTTSISAINNGIFSLESIQLFNEPG